MRKILESGLDRERRLERLGDAYEEWRRRLAAVRVLEGEEASVDCHVEFDQREEPDAHVVAHVALSTLIERKGDDDPLVLLAARLRKWADELCPLPPLVEFHGVTELYHAICAAFPEFGAGGLLQSSVSLDQSARGYVWRALFCHDEFRGDCGCGSWSRHYSAKTAAELFETVVTKGRADLATARKEKLIAERVAAEMAAAEKGGAA